MQMRENSFQQSWQCWTVSDFQTGSKQCTGIVSKTSSTQACQRTELKWWLMANLNKFCLTSQQQLQQAASSAISTLWRNNWRLLTFYRQAPIHFAKILFPPFVSKCSCLPLYQNALDRRKVECCSLTVTYPDALLHLNLDVSLVTYSDGVLVK